MANELDKLSIFLKSKKIKAHIINRPSKIIKYPRVADILINDIQYTAHSKGLGNEGLTNAESDVYCIKNSENNKTDYTIVFAIFKNTLICVDTSIAEYIVYNELLNKKMLHGTVMNIKAQKQYKNTRFDFYCELDNIPTYIEVKSVPIATKDQFSIFPEGYRKTKNDTISPRAINQMHKLIELRKNNKNCYIIYVINRNDTSKLILNKTDHTYIKTAKLCKKYGIIFLAIQVEWSLHNYVIKNYNFNICI